MKKKKWVPKSKAEKPKVDSKLMQDVEKFNPDFVKWLKAKGGKREKKD